MQSDTKHLLQSIVDVSENILNRFDYDAMGSSPKQHDNRCIFRKEIQIDLETYEIQFRHATFSTNLVKRLIAVFRQQAESIIGVCSREFGTIQDFLRDRMSQEDKKNDDHQSRLRSIFQQALKQQIEGLQHSMIEIVKYKIDRYRKEAIASSDMESSEESSAAQKGHSPRAIAILERVFAQTTNINRSEKLQLARATKLEPRQVTIWFQNRRNRKPSHQANSVIKLEQKSSTFTQQRKRKFDDVNKEVPHAPVQRRRLSDSDASPSHLRHQTPLSTSSCERSSSVDLFENGQSSRSNGGTSCGTSYDDSFSSYQDSSPAISTFGLNSFDDQVVRFTNAKKSGRSGNDKKEMMFNENGGVLLDWDDLELNCEDFKDSVSHAVTPNNSFSTKKELIGATADVVLPTSKEETNDLIMIFARKLVEEQFNAQQGLQQVQQSEGWQSPVFDKIFLAKETEQDVISLAELQSSQSSNPGGPSTSNSTQTSPRSGSPKSLFNFDFDTLGLEDSMQYNNESIEQKIDSIDLFAADETIKFDLLTSDALGLFCSSQTAYPSTATNNGTSSLTLLQ